MGQERKQIKIGIKVMIGVVIVALIAIISFILIRTNTEKEVIFSAFYYFPFGSRSMKIYADGEVYDDLEIEDPMHEPNFKYLKTLDEPKLKELKEYIANDTEDIGTYVMRLVYCTDEFGDAGQYPKCD